MKITLCGSTRFKDAYEYWNRRLTLAGHTVYSVAFFGHSEGVKADDKEVLDLVHLKKVSDSDVIFVIDCTAKLGEAPNHIYIGDSTFSEITWAFINDMRIYRASAVVRDKSSLNLIPITEMTAGWCQ